VIRALRESDWDGWKALWDGYLRFYRQKLDDEVTKRAFARLANRIDGMLGLVATDENDTPVGFAHVLIHPSTWSATAYCYLEDLFVSPAARGGGIGAELIAAVYRVADERGADRVYWHTQGYNAPARALYDEVAHVTSLVVYER
jgi:GNAT superfamily N-acetyltransferase